MRWNRCFAALSLWIAMAAVSSAAPMKALIVDGQNAHKWKETTPILKHLLEETGLFTVDVATSPEKGQDMSKFQPDFAAYRLVVLNYQGDDWPEATQKAFVDYVANGGGVVVYHFACAAFPKWKEYNQIIGVGGWGDRNEKSGAYLCWRDGKIVRGSDKPGKAGFHGPQQSFQVVVRDAEHPITQGLPTVFMHPADELYCRLRGPAENVTVLATAFAPQDKGGTDEHEPMLMTIRYGQGRVFANMLGHAGKQLKSVAFITTFLRGAEWAATGKVTQPIPADFPSADKPSIRETTQQVTDNPWVVYKGGEGPGQGKTVVLISGDEEYRSEEALAQLGKILAKRHGFTCIVLFAIDPATGMIDPTCCTNIPGLEALKTADLMIIATRYRDLPDEQMRHIVEYVEAGKPILGLRTATHAFNIPEGKTYAKYSCTNPGPDWEGGFGRQILGEKWIDHHGHHGYESTRGLIAPEAKNSPIVRGCEDIWGPTDVYEVRLPLPGDSRPLVLGQVLEGMKPTDKPVAGPKNDPMMPIAWTKTYQGQQGQVGRVFTTTMGAAVDLESEGLRRLLVNAVYWCVGLENQIPQKADVATVGEYRPLYFGFAKHRPNMKPADFALPE